MIRQQYLGQKALVCFITFMNMFIPLSIDLYLPAMPEMGAYFGAGSVLVGMTLTAFFLVFAVSIVIFGPISDKYGRRRVLIASSLLYVAASLVCGLSSSIYMLIAGRILQAAGAGAIITVATALIKECFAGSLMAKILAVTQALGVIAPMAAPLIGGFLLTHVVARRVFPFDGTRRAQCHSCVFPYGDADTGKSLPRFRFAIVDTLGRIFAAAAVYGTAYRVFPAFGALHGVSRRFFVCLH